MLSSDAIADKSNGGVNVYFAFTMHLMILFLQEIEYRNHINKNIQNIQHNSNGGNYEIYDGKKKRKRN